MGKHSKPKPRRVHFSQTNDDSSEFINIDEDELSSTSSSESSIESETIIPAKHNKGKKKKDTTKAPKVVKKHILEVNTESGSEDVSFELGSSNAPNSQVALTKEKGLKYQKVLKDSQLKLGKVEIENKQLKQTLAEYNTRFQVDSNDNKSRPSNNSTKKTKKKCSNDLENLLNDDRIAIHGKKFGVMNEIFIDHSSFLAKRPKSNPYSSDRYATVESTVQGVISELFEEVPKDLHDLMKSHTDFRDQFIGALNSNRRQIVHKLRRDIAPVIFNQSKVNYDVNADRSKLPKFVEAVYRPGYQKFSKFAPILFPGGTVDMKKLFRCQHLALMLKAILFGSSTLINARTSGPPPQGVRWGVKYITPGSIAFVAILVIFLHSKDQHLEPVGKISNIPYQETFNAFKSILIINNNNGDKITKELFDFYQKIVFSSTGESMSRLQNPQEDPDSSGIEDAIRTFGNLDISYHDEVVFEDMETKEDSSEESHLEPEIIEENKLEETSESESSFEKEAGTRSWERANFDNHPAPEDPLEQGPLLVEVLQENQGVQPKAGPSRRSQRQKEVVTKEKAPEPAQLSQPSRRGRGRGRGKAG